MAQILKDSVRQNIIAAAKQEFLEKGYKGASMRSIAAKANMTVGNLYRYYKNKEDINLSIVAPTFKEIDAAIKALNKDVSVEPRVFNLKPNIDDVKVKYDEFAKNLVDIYFKNKSEFNILLVHSRVNEEMIARFKIMVNDMISESFVFNEINVDKDSLINAYAVSLFAGIRSIFKDVKDEDNLYITLRTYIRSFISLLDNDISKFTK